ncbi:MAG: DsrE family protein [Chloroflexota bacterium]
MRLAILLTSGFEAADKRTALRLSAAALAQGHQVSLFLMGDGVYCAPTFGDLAQRGAPVVWCSHNAQQRGLPAVPGVFEGSQFEWAAMVAEADRVVSFG